MVIRDIPALLGTKERSARIALGALLMVGASLAGCASTPPDLTVGSLPVAEAPIDPNDPLARWVPYMREASARFDVPEPWIRAVMIRESGGRATVQGRTITSSAGALGLMQVMPGTYELMRNHYNLGPDPSEPRDNILAGTAYLREMFDLFGSPGFLAAYNCGPKCYAQHLAGKQKLPRETRMYIAALTPKVSKDEPHIASASSSATAVEVAVLPPKAVQAAPPAAESAVTVARAEEPVPAPPPVIVAAAPEPASEPAPSLVPAPAKETPKAKTLPAPVLVAQAQPVQPPAKAAKPNIRYQIAEAYLQPGVDPDRVQIRFVTQSNGGCGSLKGKDTVCVAQTPSGPPSRF